MRTRWKRRAARGCAGFCESNAWIAPSLRRGKRNRDIGCTAFQEDGGTPGDVDPRATSGSEVGMESHPAKTSGEASLFGRLTSREIHVGDVITVYILGSGSFHGGFTGVVLKSTPSHLHLGLFGHEDASNGPERPIVAEAIIRYDHVSCVVRRLA
ncbi:hypothetical protein IW967_04950 [Alicyclobacillus mali]|uniref:Uncharacterized protein n=1 Tax=Alicyclobacillus mali (ex Roth et al. 2021) TaxID=1123961 RepID=A0ABS0F1R4_9BACL|nr:hypothetical protein [Alicyclobacillus mali (ex Roth et al. 2021)]MBF8377216.1 hypothetical protein [Alicyclobacillus mali (ex Roth et al. 2021)]MCL6488135.1 hypothetical protein [Alicyclobacillus mali (ex Roth et al. 2021)]